MVAETEPSGEMLNESGIPGNSLDTIRVREIHCSGVEVEGTVVGALKEGVEIEIFQHVATHIGTKVSNAIFVLLLALVYGSSWMARHSYVRFIYYETCDI